jgi:hypothetical protein
LSVLFRITGPDIDERSNRANDASDPEITGWRRALPALRALDRNLHRLPLIAVLTLARIARQTGVRGFAGLPSTISALREVLDRRPLSH